MRTLHVWRALALGASLSLTACAASSLESPRGALGSASAAETARFDRLSDQLEAYVEAGRLPGGVAQVTRNGEVFFAEAFGWRDVEDAEPMTQDTIFRIASQTKAVVSAAVLILQEEGALVIQDPVGRYLPEWMDTTVAVADGQGGYDVVPADRPITIRDLLTHTSGVGYGSGFGPPTVAGGAWEEAGFINWYLIDKDATISELIADMAALPMQAQPGERWIYGYNTDVLGAVIEAASGTPLDAFLKDRIFDPLGMTDTHFYLPAEKADRLATVYSATDGGLAEAPAEGGSVSQGHYVEGPGRVFSGGAGLLSTAHDYTRFLQMLLNDGELDGARVLSRKSVELMTLDHLPQTVDFSPGEGFGLGVSVVEDLGGRGDLGSEGEFGWGGAYHSTYWVDPAEGLTVVYFTQVIPAGGVDDFTKLRALIYQAIE